MNRRHFFDHLFETDPPLEELRDENTRIRLINFIHDHAKIQLHPKMQTIVPVGAILDRIIFVDHGLVRGYYYHPKRGKTYTDYLWADHSFIFDKSLMKREPLEVNIEVLTETTIVSLFHHDIEKLFLEFPFTRRVFQIKTSESVEYSAKLYRDPDLSAEENLAELQRAYPGIANKVSRDVLASIIGVTPQYLSAIKKKH